MKYSKIVFPISPTAILAKMHPHGVTGVDREFTTPKEGDAGLEVRTAGASHREHSRPVSRARDNLLVISTDEERDDSYEGCRHRRGVQMGSCNPLAIEIRETLFPGKFKQLVFKAFSPDHNPL